MDKRDCQKDKSITYTTLATAAALLLTGPFIILLLLIAAIFFEGSLKIALAALSFGEFFLSSHLSFHSDLIYLFAAWLFLQLLLFFLPDFIHRIIKWYPGGKAVGSITPAGISLPYEINGLQAFILSSLFFCFLSYSCQLFPATILADNWLQLFLLSNLLGYLLAIFVYIKAHFFPTIRNDCYFSGSRLYDFYMGIELNPRIGKFDFKLFFNGRPGIAAWPLINLSFLFAQYKQFGTVTNSMIIVNLLQGLYVVDFFYNERWYLKTIDIAHERFGWMLSWGDLVWLPFFYTLQSLYLAYHPVELSTEMAVLVTTTGIIGYLIFRSANRQKDQFKRFGNDARIWGKKAESIPCQFLSADGALHKSALLISGWWGIVRHANYFGDLLLSYSFCMACGFENILPYSYAIFMTILLVNRCYRDEKRCSEKYGKEWDEYCQKVRYRVLPGIW